MVRHVRHFLIPHEGNSFLPHILRAKSISVLAVLVIGLFAYSGAREYLFLATDWGAEVISSVLIGFTNGDRTNAGLNTLTSNEKLAQAAQMKANDMAARGYFAHVTPDGKDPWYWFKQAGYDYEYAGENLAINFTESRDVELAWMNSPTHKSNLLNQYFTEVGIATAQGYYNGQPTVFVVQMFGKPRTYPGVFPRITPVAHAEEPSKEPLEELIVPDPAPKEPTVLVHTDTVLAVHYEPGQDAPTAQNTVEEPAAQTQSTQKVVDLPSGAGVLHAMYYIIGFLILVPIALLLRRDWKMHHRRHVSYGLALLSVMAFLIAVFDLVILPQGLII